MKNTILILLFLFCTGLIHAQSISKKKEKCDKHVYKIQVLSSSTIDSTKFMYFIEEYRCEIERVKNNSEPYRYMIRPRENNLMSANILLDEVFYHYQNPFIVVYKRGKRQN